MSSNSTRPTQSAIAVAALRAASCKESDQAVANPDYLARCFVSVGFYSLLLKLPLSLSRKLIERITPGSYCYFLARTHFIDHYFKKAVSQGIKQVVILGAGYDSRASRLLNKVDDLTVFEIDLATTQQDKLRKMKKAGIATQARKVVYIAANFNNGDLVSILRDNGFSFKQPCFFIYEGVSYYINEEANKNIFTLIGKQCAKGSAMVFDYSLQSFVNGAQDTYGGEKMQRWLRNNNEEFKFGFNVSEVSHYLQKTGLKIIEDIGPEEFSARYLQTRSGRIVGKPLGHLRMICATNA